MTEVWTAPVGFSAGDQLPAATYETNVRDNLTHLKEIVNAPLVNRDAGTLVVGDVVVLDVANTGVEKTTTDAHAGPVYVVDTVGPTAVGTSLYVHPAGSICLVKVNGAVVFGDLLKTSTTAGRANVTATATQAFARALQANASGDATILCELLQHSAATSPVTDHLHQGTTGDGGKLTSPRLVTSILDTNGNELALLTATGSAVNQVTLANAATGNKPSIVASGDDPTVGLIVGTKSTADLLLQTNSTTRATLRGNDGHLKLAKNVSFGGGTDPSDTTLMYVDNNVAGNKFTTVGTNLDGASFSPLAEITSGAISNILAGFRSRPIIESGNTQDWTADVGVRAINATTLIRPTSGTITGAAALYVANDGGTGGTVTNWYGLYMEAPTRGATNYGLYVLGGQHRIEGAIVFNDDGAAIDVRVEGDTDANLLVTDGSADRVGIGTNAPNEKLEVVGTVRADGLRLDVSPTAETPTPTHTITISVNGTNYKIPIVAA